MSHRTIVFSKSSPINSIIVIISSVLTQQPKPQPTCMGISHGLSAVALADLEHDDDLEDEVCRVDEHERLLSLSVCILLISHLETVVLQFARQRRQVDALVNGPTSEEEQCGMSDYCVYVRYVDTL
jgi:hypothetical protein